MRLIAKLLLPVMFLLAFSAVNLWGQVTTAQFNGVVVDSSGAVVPGVTVTAKDPETGFTRSALTTSTGTYVLTNLPPARYDVRVERQGFATVVQNKVILLVGQSIPLNFTLKPGTRTEVVTVTTEAPLVETSTSQIAGNVSPTEVRELPLISRNFESLMTLVPGVRPAEAFDPTKTRSGNVSIDGSDGRSVDYNVDGGDNKDNVIGGLVQNFTMEGIQEFNVVTNRYTAESGRTAGAVVNVITKSGTNTLHGSVFGLFQLSSLNMTPYFAVQQCQQAGDPNVADCKPKYHRQDFGGSIGGPIIKDKLFFFGAVENKREPGTAQMWPKAASELGIFATATTGDPGAPYYVPITGLPNPYIDWMVTAKLDWKISDRQNLSLRYGRERWNQDNDQLGNPLFADGSQSNIDINQFHDLTLTHNLVISPTKTNTITLHFQDFVNGILASPTRSFTYPIAGGGNAINPNISFFSGENVGLNVNVPQETLIRKYQFRDDFAWTRGSHSMKFGGNYIYLAKLGGYFYSAYGYSVIFADDPSAILADPITYPNGIASPNAVAEITYGGGNGSTQQPPSHSIGLYFQDDYKVTKRLTLNLGVRWDANPKFLQSQLGSSMTDSNRVVWALKETLAGLPPGFTGPSLDAINYVMANQSLLKKTTADWKEFQPRLGFAWDVFGSGKHVIRGGYGIARDQIFQNLTLWSIQQSRPTINQLVIDEINPIFRFGIDPLPAVSGTINDLAFGAVGRITDPHITDPWAQQMSIGWAWQINPQYAFSVDYIHVLGTHGERVLNLNPWIDPAGDRLMDAAFRAANICAPAAPPAVGLECAAGQPPGTGRFAHIYDYNTNNRSLYDGIDFHLQKRMSRHLQFQASYVLSWSRSWGGFPVNAYLGSPQAVTMAQQFQPNEWGRTTNDERSRVVVSGVITLPAGFELSPLFQAATPRPYSFLAGTDIDGDGRHIIDRVCVGSSIAVPITTPGCTMLPPNTINGKAFIQMDLRASKVFKFGERLRVNLTAELFNLFNRANFCNDYVETSPGTPAGYCGGAVTPAGPSGYSEAAIRSLNSQFGLRIEF